MALKTGKLQVICPLTTESQLIRGNRGITSDLNGKGIQWMESKESPLFVWRKKYMGEGKIQSHVRPLFPVHYLCPQSKFPRQRIYSEKLKYCTENITHSSCTSLANVLMVQEFLLAAVPKIEHINCKSVANS